MSRKTKSKRSSPLRLGKFQFPETVPVWKREWKNHKEIHDIEYAGLKFKALYNGYNVIVGRDLKFSEYGHICTASMAFTGSIEGMGGDGNSCAYQKISPQGKDRDTLIMFSWWLDNFYIPRGTVCYLTKNDGNVDDIKKVLNRRGFRTACVTKSKHAGHYPVYLLTHPGDAALLAKKNKNKVVENADVLGNSDANVPQPGIVGGQPGGNTAPGLIPVAYALGA